jgi:hypothetical protein
MPNINDYKPMGMGQAFDNLIRPQITVFDINEAVAVVPNDAANLAKVANSLYIGGAGDVHVLMANGADIIFTGMLAGVVYRISAKKVFATGTTATNIVALND